MFEHEKNAKIFALFIYFLAFLISVLHVFYPITISPPDISERTGVPVIFGIFIWLAASGHSGMRVTVGVTYCLFAAINFLIFITYFGAGNWVQIGAVTIVLAAVGFTILTKKEMRVFEKEREARRSLQNPA